MLRKILAIVLGMAMALCACGVTNNNENIQNSQKESLNSEDVTETGSESTSNSEMESVVETNSNNNTEDEMPSVSDVPMETEKDSSVETEEPTEEIYTYCDLDKTMWVKSSVNVRDLPSTDGKKIGKLTENQEVKVTGQCNETLWYRIEFNETIAFVSNNYLQDTKIQTGPTNINKVMYVVKTVRGKVAPSANAKNKGYMHVGTEQWVISEQNGWYAIRWYDGSIGYIQTKYLTDDPTKITPPKSEFDDEYYVNWNGHLLLLSDRYSQASLEYKRELAYKEYFSIVYNYEQGRYGMLIPSSDSLSYPYASLEEHKLMKNKMHNLLYREAELRGYIIGQEEGSVLGGGGNFDSNGLAYQLEVYFIDPRKTVVELNGHDVGIHGMNNKRKEYLQELAEAEYFTVKACEDSKVCCGIVVPDKSYLEQGYTILQEYVAGLEHYGLMEDEMEDAHFLYRDYAFDSKTGAWIIEFYFSYSID